MIEERDDLKYTLEGLEIKLVVITEDRDMKVMNMVKRDIQITYMVADRDQLFFNINEVGNKG